VTRLPAAVGLVTVSVTQAPVAPVGTPLVPVTGMVTVAPAATGPVMARLVLLSATLTGVASVTLVWPAATVPPVT
jgi:hypothetical protein